jgi:hypothetical protein
MTASFDVVVHTVQLVRNLNRPVLELIQILAFETVRG